jgi:predicted CXXCH cytochrome family protein
LHKGEAIGGYMKKYVSIILVCVLVMAISALSGVDQTKHNFTSQTYSPNAFFYGTRQVCVFCHTVHNADQTLGTLWNHEDNPAQTYNMYSSNTLDMIQASKPHEGSLVCLSCHDGTIAVNALNNLPGPEGAGSYGTPGGSALDGSGKLTSSSNAYVGWDLPDDHPVGITYDASRDPTGFVAKTGVPTSYPDRLLSEDLYVECSSCHDPHDNTNSNFLVISNENSNLCTKCHTK